jgi:hypothetical protein
MSPCWRHACRWIAAWLENPLPALGDKRPGKFTDTAEGRGLVLDLLADQPAHLAHRQSQPLGSHTITSHNVYYVKYEVIDPKGLLFPLSPIKVAFLRSQLTS